MRRWAAFPTPVPLTPARWRIRRVLETGARRRRTASNDSASLEAEGAWSPGCSFHVPADPPPEGANAACVRAAGDAAHRHERCQRPPPHGKTPIDDLASLRSVGILPEADLRRALAAAPVPRRPRVPRANDPVVSPGSHLTAIQPGSGGTRRAATGSENAPGSPIPSRR